jgi:hypothetical protein
VKTLAEGGIAGGVRQPNAVVYETRLLSELEQRQRLVLAHGAGMLERSALIVSLADQATGDDASRTYERVRRALLDRFGNPSFTFDEGAFGPGFAADLAAGRFIRLTEWTTQAGHTIRLGIPRPRRPRAHRGPPRAALPEPARHELGARCDSARQDSAMTFLHRIIAALAMALLATASLAQQPAKKTDFNATCLPCRGFAQTLRMYEDAIAALQQERDKRSAALKVLADKLLDGRPLSDVEKDQGKVDGNALKAVLDKLDALEVERANAEKTLNACIQKYCPAPDPQRELWYNPGMPQQPFPQPPQEPQLGTPPPGLPAGTLSGDTKPIEMPAGGDAPYSQRRWTSGSRRAPNVPSAGRRRASTATRRATSTPPTASWKRPATSARRPRTP